MSARALLATACAAARAAGSARGGQVAIAASADNTIYSESATSSNGQGSFLFSGRNAQNATRRALLRFDVASAIPAGSIVQSATLELSVSQASSGTETVAIHRVLASWGEGASDAPGSEGSGVAAQASDATWTERFFGGALAWTSAGGDYDATPSATLAVGGPATWAWSSPALAADVQHWLDVPAAAHGWIVLGNETIAGTAKRFESRHGTGGGVVPRLVVDFAPGCVPPASACAPSPNSVGPGASILFAGTTSIAAGDLALGIRDCPPGVTGLFLLGPPATPVPLAAGTLCAGSPLRRFPAQTTDAAGIARLAADFASGPLASLSAGDEVVFQFWYRDPAGPGALVNLSEGLRIRFCP